MSETDRVWKKAPGLPDALASLAKALQYNGFALVEVVADVELI